VDPRYARFVPTTSRKNGRERRDALLDAALQCFARRGVLETGIEDVRRAAGASPSSVYHLFGGMNDLVVGLLERTIERLYGAINAAAAQATTAEGLVHAIVTAHLDWVLANRAEARFLYQALALELAGTSRRQIERTKAKLRTPTMERLSAWTERGELPAWPPHALETVLLGPSHQACRYLLAGGAVDMDWMCRTLPSIAWRSVTPAAPSPATRPPGKRTPAFLGEHRQRR